MNRRPSFGPRWFGAIAFLIAFLFPALMNAQIDRTKPPKPSPAPDVNIGAHETFLLANGMRVIVVENHRQPLVSVQVKFDPSIQTINTGTGGLVMGRPGCDATDSSQCTCSSNKACLELSRYQEVPFFMRQALRDYGLADPTMRGLH